MNIKAVPNVGYSVIKRYKDNCPDCLMPALPEFYDRTSPNGVKFYYACGRDHIWFTSYIGDFDWLGDA